MYKGILFDYLTNSCTKSEYSRIKSKAPVSSSSESQTSSAIKLTTPSVSYAREEHQNNYVLYSQNNTKNDATITNNDDIQSYDTPKQIITF